MPFGSRGCLIPTDRKNPRFPAGSKFEIKKRLNNQILIKFQTSNSIFAIMESESEQILGMSLSQYLKEVDRLKAEGIKRLSQALIEAGFFQSTQAKIIGGKNEG
jgi:hypothetical protein